MDRHFFAALFVAVITSLGCSNQDAAQPAEALSTGSGPMLNGGSAAPLPTVAENHHPIIVGPEAGDFPAAAEPTAAQPTAAEPTAAEPSSPTSPAHGAPPPQSASFAPTSPVPAEPAAPAPPENPLRRMRAAPQTTAAADSPGSAAPTDDIAIPAAPATPPLAMDLGGLSGETTFAALANSPSGPYDVVEVFYGTDRLSAELLVDTLPARFLRFLPASCSALVTLCLAVIAASRRGLGMWLLALGALGVSLGLGLQATSNTIAAVRQAGKEGVRYTSERSPTGQIDLGLCSVTIPKSHTSGELESPSILRLEVREDAAQHVIQAKTERLASEPFFTLLRQRVADSPRHELFVFVHGFNVTFEDAARRTAQIHHDLKFAGAPVFFSWPAHDKFVVTYPADENNVSWSTPHLKQFLLEIVKESQAQSINLVAHSMGNRALAAALREIELELKDNARLFNQVILAAPDIDADEFRRHIAPAMQRTARRMTLYASSRDDALLASRLLHRGPRAGDAGEGLVVVSGIDTIDVTAIDTSPWGHSYYGSSDPVLNDLKAMLMLATPPHERTWLSPAELHGLPYWIFQPTRTAAADGPAPR